MITLRVFFFAILAVKRFDCFQAVYPSTVGFYYKNDSVLDISIILQNVPLEANNYVLYYQTENCDKNNTDDKRGYKCNVPAKNETIPRDGVINIMQRLNKASLRVYIELRKTKTKLCSTKIILDAVRDPAVVSAENTGFRACLNRYFKLCNITVDFAQKCDATTQPHLVNNNQGSQEPISGAEVGTDKTKYYIGIASVAGIVIMILLIYFLIKKLRQKSSGREQTLQLETYASTNMTLYAELDTRPGVAQGPFHINDTIYAEIVGVLVPSVRDVKGS